MARGGLEAVRICSVNCSGCFWVCLSCTLWKAGINVHSFAHRWPLLLFCTFWNRNNLSSWITVISPGLCELHISFSMQHHTKYSIWCIFVLLCHHSPSALLGGHLVREFFQQFFTFSFFFSSSILFPLLPSTPAVCSVNVFNVLPMGTNGYTH